jgi:arginine deiminase
MIPDADLPSAYGGAGWSPRTAPLSDELGTVWAQCGSSSEVARLNAVLLHRPGAELAVADPDAAQFLGRLNVPRAAAQHDALAAAYRTAGVVVHYVDPLEASPNLMYCADLFFMTPSGAILARPASAVRAGEERWVARRLAELGVPILRSVAGRGVFEGADALWLDEATVLIGRGLRTNAEGAAQVADTLASLAVRIVVTDLPRGAMHLMGQLRIVDRDLALVRRGRLDDAALAELRRHGYAVEFFPDETELDRGFAHNFVVLEPRRILMPGGNPTSRAFYERLGIAFVAVQVDELARAAGAVGCLTGVLWRESGTA